MLFAGTSVAAYADFNPHPNPNNRGHHYGWYKHNHVPPPVPTPAPNPAPNPHSTPSPAPKAGVTTTSHSVPSASGLPGLIAQLDSAVSDLAPARERPESDAGIVTPGDAGDPLWWLILLLLPALAALASIAVRGLVREGAAGRPVQVAAAGTTA